MCDGCEEKLSFILILGARVRLRQFCAERKASSTKDPKGQEEKQSSLGSLAPFLIGGFPSFGRDVPPGSLERSGHDFWRGVLEGDAGGAAASPSAVPGDENLRMAGLRDDPDSLARSSSGRLRP